MSPRLFLSLFLCLLATACVVVGDDPADLGEIEAVLPLEVDASTFSPTNCGHQEVLDIELSNTAGRAVNTWAQISSQHRIREWAGEPMPGTNEQPPVVLEPGEKATFSLSLAAYAPEPQLFSDIVSARVLVSNMDPTDPVPPTVRLSSRDRCEAGYRTDTALSPVGVDPAGLSHARQAMADITPDICPTRERSGGVVRNNSATEATVWAAWSFELANGEPSTWFSPPARLAPGQETTLAVSMENGRDAIEVVIMTDGPAAIAGDPAADLAVTWFDSCVP